MLGVNAQTLTAELAAAFNLGNNKKGALITEVQKGSAAERGGLRIGDLVIKIGSTTPITTAPQLISAFGQLTINTIASLTIVRNGKNKFIRVQVSDKTTTETLDGVTLHQQLAGATFGTTSRLSISKNQAATTTTVLLVTDIKKGSAAAKVGILVKDEVVSVNKKPVASIADFKKAFASGNRLNIILKRGNRLLTLRVNK